MEWAWKYCLNFLDAITRKKASPYLDSEPRPVVEYTGSWRVSASLTRIALTIFSDTTKYSKRGSHGLGFDSSRTSPKCYFSAWKAASHSSIHWNFFPYFRTLKKDKLLSIALEMKRLSATIRPFRISPFLASEVISSQSRPWSFQGLLRSPFDWQCSSKIGPMLS